MKTTYPIKTICEILDLTDRRVRQLVTDGILPKKSERGRYELIPTVRAYIHWLRDRSLYGEAKARNGNIVSLDEARRRKLIAEAELAELELQKERGEVVSIAETEKSWSAVLSAVRAKMLALPTTMAAVASVETDQKIVKELLSKAVEQALTELSAIDVGPSREVSESSDQNSSENVAATAINS
uniref:Phage DNA packaging protein, Nu1 subunit of terminase n=1 Tax=uncultured nuHF2 cluster bacterium HF0770_42C12 TaxID=723593 RepID=E7C7Y8_9BACT|nr:hypothetical protein [uncultured nuHF2 cluster bacterium HF0770_42C12]